MSRIAPLMIFLCVLCGFLCGHFSQPLKPTPAPRVLPPVKPKPATERSPTKDIDFSNYMEALQKQIKRHWFPPKVGKTSNAKAKFRINRDGSLGPNVEMRIFSGIRKFDDAAVLAIENAAPFEPLPEGSPEFVEVEFTFNYNVFQPKK